MGTKWGEWTASSAGPLRLGGPRTSLNEVENIELSTASSEMKPKFPSRPALKFYKIIIGLHYNLTFVFDSIIRGLEEVQQQEFSPEFI